MVYNNDRLQQDFFNSEKRYASEFPIYLLQHSPFLMYKDLDIELFVSFK